MKTPAVFTPDNEPYLGRESVFQYDQVIMSCMEINSEISIYTHQNLDSLSDLQRAATQIIPQGVNLALSIRELVRQGYLFAALVLMRPLIERAAIISYLHANPEEVATWKNGWKFKERPPLSKMLETMSGNADIEEAKKICEMFGHIVHGDPVGAEWNLVSKQNGGLGYSTGKILNDPDLCDFICYQSYLYLIVLMGMMSACFPALKIH